jgi:hypothetical protein
MKHVLAASAIAASTLVLCTACAGTSTASGDPGATAAISTSPSAASRHDRRRERDRCEHGDDRERHLQHRFGLRFEAAATATAVRAPARRGT